MIIVKPHSGLSNRMRCIESSYKLSKILETSLLVKWNRSPYLNCSFDDLFKILESFSVQETGYTSIKDNGRIDKVISKYLQLPFYKLAKYTTFHNKEVKSINKTIINKLKQSSNIYINSGEDFLTDMEWNNIFQPTSEIQNQINKYSEGFHPYTFGIHIRRGDNTKSIKQSPMLLFINKIDEILGEIDKAKFFLATDSIEIEKELKERYNGRIVTTQKILDRNSVAGIKDALIDLFCLSNTSKIYGSYWSSFSEIASKIGSISLEILKAENT